MTANTNKAASDTLRIMLSLPVIAYAKGDYPLIVRKERNIRIVACSDPFCPHAGAFCHLILHRCIDRAKRITPGSEEERIFRLVAAPRDYAAQHEVQP